MLNSCYGMIMDTTDIAIVQALREDSRLSMRKLAAVVHMSAPAVAERVRRLEEEGVITGYTIRVDEQKIAPRMLAYVNVHMKTNHHQSFLQLIEGREEVRECHRIAGGNVCYLLKLEVIDQSTLNEFLDILLPYANYSLNVVIASTIKP
ncbi:transcriptional regulator [Ktedonobacter sp. SOSP1-52]|nr:transcriptional regulator [Ktedonobacter sp. SOSP1-52]